LLFLCGHAVVIMETSNLTNQFSLLTTVRYIFWHQWGWPPMNGEPCARDILWTLDFACERCESRIRDPVKMVVGKLRREFSDLKSPRSRKYNTIYWPKLTKIVKKLSVRISSKKNEQYKTCRCSRSSKNVLTIVSHFLKLINLPHRMHVTSFTRPFSHILNGFKLSIVVLAEIFGVGRGRGEIRSTDDIPPCKSGFGYATSRFLDEVWGNCTGQ
jgi:hypothetical protein